LTAWGTEGVILSAAKDLSIASKFFAALGMTAY
jgi:hypothetical protein